MAGFADDTIVAAALEALAAAAGVEPAWSVRITKTIPVAAGLGGGSSDAASALRLANGLLDHPLEGDRLEALAATIGADVPFFLRTGPQLGTGDGTVLEALDLPQDFWVVLVLPRGSAKASTADVYRAFDARNGAEGFAARRAALLEGLADVRRPRDLARLPAERSRCIAARRPAEGGRRISRRCQRRRAVRLRPLRPAPQGGCRSAGSEALPDAPG